MINFPFLLRPRRSVAATVAGIACAIVLVAVGLRPQTGHSLRALPSAEKWQGFLYDFLPPFWTGPDECITDARYDVEKVDWAALKADLKELVSTCGCAPILVRLSWHDSGTYQASDGSGGSRGAQRFPDGESQHAANAGLDVARGILQPYKERHPQVGYADLWALAAVTAIEWAGGPVIPYRAGRTDIRTAASCVAEGRLPDGDRGAKHIRTIFYRMGFTDPEIVALSGAHTLGKCRADRSGFEGPWTETPLRFDTRYFELLLECEWEPSEASTGLPQMACPSEPELMMLNTDVALITDPTFRQTTELYAKDAARFHADFSTAFVKLQEHGHPSLVDVGV